MSSNIAALVAQAFQTIAVHTAVAVVGIAGS